MELGALWHYGTRRTMGGTRARTRTRTTQCAQPTPAQWGTAIERESH